MLEIGNFFVFVLSFAFCSFRSTFDVNQPCKIHFTLHFNIQHAMEHSKSTIPAADEDFEYVRQPLMAIQSWMQHTERELKAVRSDLDAHRQFQYNSNDSCAIGSDMCIKLQWTFAVR